MKKHTIFCATILMAAFCSNVHSQTTSTATSYFQFNTNFGYIQMGPSDVNSAQISTDRPKFLFNKDIYSTTGVFSSSSSSIPVSLKTNGATRLHILPSNGYVGIGTVTPTEMLTVNGTISTQGLSVSGTMSAIGIRVPDNSIIRYGDVYGATGAFSITHNANTNTYCDISNGNLYFRRTNGLSNLGAIMGLQKDGTVTIGVWEKYDNTITATDGAKLMVNGGILCERVKVINDVPNSDHVFLPAYRLMPLGELKQYVTENKHLPEVPSAAEFQKDGYSLGQMDDLLLRKVEELTLYIIQLQEELAKQQETINGLK